MAEVVPILMYHHVSRTAPDGFAKYTVHPDALRRQITWLQRFGYRPIGLDGLAGAMPRGGRRVALTFDDGFAEAIDEAVPILTELGATATFFLVSGLLGGRSEWLRREVGVELPIVTASDIRQLLPLGFTIGSHTVSHPHLPRLDDAALADELAGARTTLEDVVGARVTQLAYPHGETDERVLEAARSAGYTTAVTTDAGFAGAASAPLALPRIIVDGRDRLADLACRLRTAERCRDVVRRGPLRAARALVAGPAGSRP